MADNLEKVRSGQSLRIPASTWNAMIDSIKVTRGLSQDTTVNFQRDLTRSSVLVKNTSTNAVPRFGVLGIDGPTFDPQAAPDAFKRRIVLNGSTPNKMLHYGKFVIALEPIAADAVGMACASGLCPARVNFPGDPIGQERTRHFADIVDGSSANLTARDIGAATIIWKAAGTGLQWAIVRIDDGGTAPRIFPITLQINQMKDGTAASITRHTYNILDPETGEIFADGTGIDPGELPHQWKRTTVGNYVPATFGLAYRDRNDELIITWINEVPVVSACTPF